MCTGDLRISVTLNGSEFADVLPAHEMSGLAGPPVAIPGSKLLACEKF
jgi:hypothetical protein